VTVFLLVVRLFGLLVSKTGAMVRQHVSDAEHARAGKRAGRFRRPKRKLDDRDSQFFDVMPISRYQLIFETSKKVRKKSEKFKK